MIERQRWSYGGYFCLLLLVGASAYLRLETLGQRMIWFDETYTDILARLGSLPEVIGRSYRDFGGNVPPLHYILCFLHYQVSDSVSSLRMTSVESGVLTVLALVAVGCRLFSRSVGLVAGALMACCVYHINYSQDARPYALLVLFVVLSFLCVFGFLATGRWRWLPAFIAAAAGSVYTHHFAWISQASIAVILACSAGARYAGRPLGKQSGPSWKSILLFSALAYAVLGLLYLPLLSNLVKLFAHGGPGQAHVLDLSFRFFWELFGRWGNGASWSLLYASCFVVGGVAILSRRDVSLSVILWFAVPFGVFALLPTRSRLFDIRYLMSALPAFLLIVAVGIVTLASLGQRLLAGLRTRLLARVLAREWTAEWAPWMQKVAVRNVLVVGLTLFFVGLSLDTYRSFRPTRIRCSQFYGTEEILERHDGFCRKHLILNSLYPPHSFIWKKHGSTRE